MKKLLSFALALVLCLGLTLPASAVNELTVGEYNTVACSDRFTAVIDTDGVLWTWGSNDYGMLGIGKDRKELDSSVTHMRVMDNVVSVSCGGGFVAAIRGDNSLWMWGSNRVGQLGNNCVANAGDGWAVYQTSPIKIMDNVAQVVCGLNYVAALKTDGSLWTWGSVARGVLGNGFTWNASRGNIACQTVPVKIMDDVTYVATGTNYMAAVKTNGSLWTWGTAGGYLGNGGVSDHEVTQYETSSPVPFQSVPLKIMDGVEKVWCTQQLTLIQKTDQTIWYCGKKTDGPDFITSLPSTDVPVQTNLRNIAAFGDLGYIAEDGSLWMWGFAVDGMDPVKVLDHVTGVGYSRNANSVYMAVRDDNTLWGWGHNSVGELGVTTVEWRAKTPIKIIDGVATSAAAPKPTVAGFSDVYETDYYAEAVEWAKENGVTGGTNAAGTTFSPAATVTRAEAVTFLWRAASSPEPSTTVSPFTDVTDSSAYYYKAVLWAAEHNIAGGIGNNLFGLNNTLTYDQILALLCRTAGESASSSDWSAAAVNWAKENGLTDGLTFTAKGSCPRADVVYCLWKQLA